MKTRKDIYGDEAKSLINTITIYHALKLEQVLQLYPKKEESLKKLITSLIKQKRIYYDEENKLLCDSFDFMKDNEMITAFWVLLDFKTKATYHTSSSFPAKIYFFAEEQVYDIIYVKEG